MFRYQNQRHPSNKVAPKANVKQTTGGEHLPGQDNATSSGLTKREPLLPTPPSTQMVKLDTTLTCKTYIFIIRDNYVYQIKLTRTSFIQQYKPENKH